jgi:hypothetical protein
MLSSEAYALTRLILARQMLICRAIELDTKAEVLTVAGPAAASWETFREVGAELALIPALLENLEVEIAAAQGRLSAVSHTSGHLPPLFPSSLDKFTDLLPQLNGHPRAV